MAGRTSEAEVKVRLDETLHARLTYHLPMYGGISWAVRTSLESLCEELDNNPSLVEHVQAAVRRSISR